MNFYEILKTKKLGRGSPDYRTQLFAEHVGGKGEWAVSELTGVLPMTFRSNGTALIDYRIYGTADGAGVQTENLFDKNATDTANGYVDGEHLKNNGTTRSNRLWAITEYIPVTDGNNYTFNYGTLSSSPAICYYDSSKQFIQGIVYGGQNPKVVSISSGVSYIRFSFLKSYADVIMLVQANSLPSTYIPYGYKLPLTIASGTKRKDTDIYIGDSKLGEAEYVDYGEQKVYKRTENLFDENSEKVSGYINTHGELVQGVFQTYTYDYFDVNPSSEYTYKAQSASSALTTIRVNFYTSEKVFISRSFETNGALNSRTITTPSDCYYIRLSNDDGLNGVTFVKGSTAPSEYIPYLQPTDPPLSLPTIETFNGTNTLDSTETLGTVTIKGQIKPQS